MVEPFDPPGTTGFRQLTNAEAAEVLGNIPGLCGAVIGETLPTRGTLDLLLMGNVTLRIQPGLFHGLTFQLAEPERTSTNERNP